MSRLPPVQVDPYDDHSALAVLSWLDPMDQKEAELMRGRRASHLELFADWRSVEPARVVSLVLKTSDTKQPFAVLGLCNTGQLGVASAALLARDHAKFRLPLITACLLIREQMPMFCAENGIRRIEARSWRDHPRAARFLKGCGFVHEAVMPGFGGDADAIFCQFAWTHPTEKET